SSCPGSSVSSSNARSASRAARTSSTRRSTMRTRSIRGRRWPLPAIRRTPVTRANMIDPIREHRHPSPFAAVLLAAALAGCAVTQPAPPRLDLPAPTATAEQNALLEKWWIAFDDPVLTTLIDEAFANNLDLKAALTRIELARSNVLLAQSYLYPKVDL